MSEPGPPCPPAGAWATVDCHHCGARIWVGEWGVTMTISHCCPESLSVIDGSAHPALLVRWTPPSLSTVGAGRPCYLCGIDATWQDMQGRPAHPGCVKRREAAREAVAGG